FSRLQAIRLGRGRNIKLRRFFPECSPLCGMAHRRRAARVKSETSRAYQKTKDNTPMTVPLSVLLVSNLRKALRSYYDTKAPQIMLCLSLPDSCEWSRCVVRDFG